MRLAYSYIRFSSEKQQLGDSLRRQLKLAEDYAAKHNLVLDSHSYRDLGISAFKGKNFIEGKLGTFLAAVDQGVIAKNSFLLVESLDRISRAQVDEALELFLSIIRRGITIVTLMDEQIYSSERIKQDRGISLIVSLTYMMRAHEESATKSARVKASHQSRTAGWKPGDRLLSKRGPAWLKANDTLTGWVQIPEKVATVQRIYRMALTMGAPKIADALNVEGVIPLDDAKFWSHGGIGTLLKLPTTKGEFHQKHGGDRIIEGYFPAIINPEQWLRVQQAIASRAHTGGTKSERVSNLFSALSRCLYCGTATRYVPTTGKYAYVHCLKAYSKGGCPARPFPYAAAETAILDRLMNVQQNWSDNSVNDDVAEEKVLLQAQIDERKRMQERAIQTQLIAGNVAALGEALKNIQAEIEALEAKRDALSVEPLTRKEQYAALELFGRHQTMKANGDHGLAELRASMQQALRRQLRKIEWGPEFLSSAIWASEGRKFLQGKISRFWISQEPNYILQLTFASGTVRVVDATPFTTGQTQRKARRPVTLEESRKLRRLRKAA